MSATFFIVIGTVIAVVYAYVQYTFGYWKRKGIAHAETIFPYGSLKGVSRTANLGEILKSKYFEAKNLPCYGLHFLLSPVLLVRDPLIVKDVLIKEFNNFHDRGIYLNSEKNPLANHLFFLSGKRWRNLRIKLTPTFTSGKMKMMFSTMVKSGEEMIEYLKNRPDQEEAEEMKNLFANYSTNVIARCAFGIELDAFRNTNSQFRDLSKFFTQPGALQTIANILLFSASKILVHIPFSLLPKNVSNFFIGVVDDTIKHREQNKIKNNDFLQLMIELKNKGYVEDNEVYSHGEEVSADHSEVKKEFTVKDAAAQSFQFFVAGFETASSTLQYCLFELARNQDVQNRLREEVDLAFSKNTEMTYEKLYAIPYLDQILSETLRKYPAVSFITRESNSPYHIPNSDIVLEAGSRIVISTGGLHHDPEYFPEPEKFDPDRFSADNKDSIVPLSYLPFGDGPRTCIGMRFAQMQMKIALAQFISKYKVNLCEKSPIPPLKFEPKAILNSLKGGMYLKVTNR